MTNNIYSKRFGQQDRQAIVSHLDKLLNASIERLDRRQQTIFTDEKSGSLFMIIGMSNDWLGVQRKTIDEALRLIEATDDQRIMGSSKIVLAKKTPDTMKVFSGSLYEFLQTAVQDLTTDNQDKYQLHTIQSGESMAIKEMPTLELHFTTSILFDNS